MVRLDRLVAQGFKSFSGKIALPFPENFVAVAGPNGSGKSNIVDALNFVLGTSRARTIRAKKLKNLIFNGSPTKKPAEWCEVSLYLNNESGKIPNYDKEIKISRKITRSGLSVYKINGKSVNRNKILDLLSNANISANGYNIIMQGDVSRIIEMSPMDRREIIEEISGISEFDDKKEKAGRELEKVETRVRETMIIIAEKQKFVTRLKYEKERAERFVKLEKELKKAKASLLHLRLTENEKEYKKYDNKIIELESNFKKIDSNFGNIEKELTQLENDIQKTGDEIISKSRNIELMREVDKIHSDIARKKDRIDFNEITIEQQESIKSITGESSRAVKEILSLNKEGVYGPLKNLIKIPQKYSTAIEVALGRHKDDVIVDTQKTAIECVKHLKSTKAGRARFIPLDIIHGRPSGTNIENSIGYAIDLIEFDIKFEKALQYALGNTIVVDTIDTARNIKQIRTVTLDGDLKEASGAITGGHYFKKHRVNKETINNTKDLMAENEQLENEIRELDKKLKKLESEQKDESQDVKKLQQKRESLEAKLDNIRKQNKESFEKRSTLQSEISNLKIKKAHLEANIDNIKIEMQEFKNQKDYYKLSMDELKSKLHTCNTEINKLGPINLKAIEEFQTYNIEFEELKNKMDKLLKEKDSVINIVSEIEKKRYGKFMESLEEVAGHFNRIYKDLMGGVGILRLEESENIDSGLIIEASPEGKRILNIDSMSGGEKSMTSLAFLFSIQQHDPAPFYILDEVDAALDKVNTKKIAKLVEKYSKDVQFLVITHNDITISASDRVYGVSMDQGASKIFGIKMPSEVTNLIN